MLSRAKSKHIRVSPYKLRPIVNVIRGKAVDDALAWLKAYSVKRVRPITKTLLSAYANAKNLNAEITSMDMLFVKEIKVNQAAVISYYKPGAMGRASTQRKRLSHLEIVLDRKK